MNKLSGMLAGIALLVSCGTGQAAVIDDLGPNPTSAGGNFQNAPPAGLFEDQFTFQLIGAPQFITIASVTNTFAQGSDFISSFTAAVWTTGVDGIVNNGDDVAVIGPVAAGACFPPSPFCQGMAGTALLNAGAYYIEMTGDAGTTAGYAGNLSTAAVPGPIVGAGIPGLFFAAGGLALLARRKQRK